jgi:glyoxylase-like metal-dependent hydrolase (beta-lactamase superfamily II)/ferredoxin
MATPTRQRPQNVAGDFYVDTSCIDCDTCRWMAPEVFRQIDDQSAVYQQPNTPQQRAQAMQALLSCPTGSIGTHQKPADTREIQAQFPLPVVENIYHCGYHAESSFGAASYLIQRPEGNVLVDSPRFVGPLVKRLEAMGGVKWLYLTHRDDVADHQKFQDHFGCDRILHRDDVGPNTESVERQLTGPDSLQLEPDLLILPVPGHTKGHTVLLYQSKFLFSGDHLAARGSWDNDETLPELIAFRNACWYSWATQIESMQRLTHYSFEWVLPGHGRRYHAPAPEMQQQLHRCLYWMKS